MTQYMLLLYANEKGGEALSPQDMAMWMRKMGEYGDALKKANALISTGGLGRVLVTFGRVPLFFYCLQWAWAHVAGLVISAIQGYSLAPYFMNVLRIVSLPERPEMGGPLWTTHAAWIVGTVVLYFPCRWFAELKARRRDWWLSYL